MDFHDTVFKIIFQIVRHQNIVLLREIAMREKIPDDFHRRWTPRKEDLETFLKSRRPHLQNSHPHGNSSDHPSNTANPDDEDSQVDTLALVDDNPSSDHD